MPLVKDLSGNSPSILGAAGVDTHVDGDSPSAVYSGQLTVSATAQRLPITSLANGVQLRAGSGNAGNVYIGPAGVTTATGYPLAAGSTISYNTANLGDLYYIGTAADTLAYTAN